MEKFDLAVIGAGPGGYITAIHAAKSGLKVALIERHKVGGACYNVGCIPSKIMLEHSKLMQTMQAGEAWGITAQDITVDFPKLMSRKDSIINELLENIEHYIESNAITFYRGEASVEKNLTIRVGDASLTATDIVLATGSKPFVPPFEGLETASYYTTDTFFNMTTLPKELTIIGGGVIAVEMAFSLAPLGTKVTILNYSKDILQTEEPDARPIIKEKMRKLGIALITDFAFEKFEGNQIYTSKGIHTYENLLFATGRRPNVAIAEDLQLKFDGRLIAVDEHYETSLPHVYAIGDLVGGFQLAHAASAEGIHVVEHILQHNPKPINQNAIPRCVYTQPEIATFGLLEHEVNEPVTIINLPLKTNSKALMEGNIEGLVKIVAAKDSGDILGACVVGEKATEIINSLLAIKTAGHTAKQLATIIFPHPTMSEHVGDALREVFGKGIHV